MVSLLVIYGVSISLPWFTSILYYSKHISIFLLISYISYLIIESVYLNLNDAAKTDKQIKLNGIYRVIIQVVILVVIMFAQVRYIERKDTLSIFHCNFYDNYGNMIYESEIYSICPEFTVINSTESNLEIEFHEETDMLLFETYFYYPHIDFDYDFNKPKNLSFELFTTVDITYNQLGYIDKSITTYSLIVDNHDNETSVLTTKQVILDNTYDNQIYTSLKTTKMSYDTDYSFTGEIAHMSLDGAIVDYVYTYSTFAELTHYDQVDLYSVVSDEFGVPLENEIPEVLFTSEIQKLDSSLIIDVRASFYRLESVITEVAGYEEVHHWKTAGNIPYVRRGNEYNNLSVSVRDQTTVIDVQDDGDKIIMFSHYFNGLTRYPTIIEVSDFGFIQLDYTRRNQNFFKLEEEVDAETWEVMTLVNFNLYNIYEVYDSENFFDINDYNTLYQIIPCYYNYKLD
jgi:hypothetical protein